MLDSNGGMQSAPGVSLYPVGLPAAVSFWLGRKSCRRGMLGNLIATGGMQSAGA